MKKKLIALLVLFLTSCSSNTNNISINTELASFLDKFNKVYPNGFVLEDGYYEITKETQSFNINENTRTFKNENFKGKLVQLIVEFIKAIQLLLLIKTKIILLKKQFKNFS